MNTISLSLFTPQFQYLGTLKIGFVAGCNVKVSFKRTNTLINVTYEW